MRDLAAVRQEIDEIDEHLITCLAKRQRLVEEAGLLKPKNDTQAVNAKNVLKKSLEIVASVHEQQIYLLALQKLSGER